MPNKGIVSNTRDTRFKRQKSNASDISKGFDLSPSLPRDNFSSAVAHVNFTTKKNSIISDIEEKQSVEERTTPNRIFKQTIKPIKMKTPDSGDELT